MPPPRDASLRRGRLRRAGARALAAGLGVVLALVALEVVLRSLGTTPLQRHAMSSFHDGHPRYGWLGEKDYRARFRRDEFDIEIRSGADGFRVPAEALPLAGGRRPLVSFLGDSFTWGWGVASGEVFTDRLQARLEDRWVVKNHGVNGFGTAQERILLEEHVLPLGPERVALMFFANDPDDAIDDKDGKRPWFRLADGELVAENLPVANSVASPLRRLMRRSLALSGVRYGLNALGDGLRMASLPAAPPIVYGSQRRQVSPGWPVSAALLRAMAGLCAAATPPVDFRIVYVPTPADVVLAAEEGPLPAREALVALCREAGIPLLDLTPAFARAWSEHPESGPRGEPYYFTLDQHWTPLGHGLVASHLEEAWNWSSEASTGE